MQSTVDRENPDEEGGGVNFEKGRVKVDYQTDSQVFENEKANHPVVVHRNLQKRLAEDPQLSNLSMSKVFGIENNHVPTILSKDRNSSKLKSSPKKKQDENNQRLKGIINDRDK